MDTAGKNIRKRGKENPFVPDEIITNIVRFQLKNGWRKGHVLKVVENSKYEVSINEASKTEELQKCSLRAIKEWVDGSWVQPNLHLQKNGTESEFKRKEVRIRIICSGNSMSQFSKGTTVEVRSDEEGYKGSWYTAVIVGPKGNNEYVVEYKTLTTDDLSGD